MISKDDVIFEPSNTPNKNWVKELDSRHMDSSLSSFKAPKNDNRVITLCKPFVVFFVDTLNKIHRFSVQINYQVKIFSEIFF